MTKIKKITKKTKIKKTKSFYIKRYYERLNKKKPVLPFPPLSEPKKIREKIHIRIPEDYKSDTILDSSVEESCILAYYIFSLIEDKSGPGPKDKSMINAPRWHQGNKYIPSFAQSVIENGLVKLDAETKKFLKFTETLFGMVSMEIPKEKFSKVPLKFENYLVTPSLGLGFIKPAFRGLINYDVKDKLLLNAGFRLIFEDDFTNIIYWSNSFDGTADGLLRKMKISFQYIIDKYFK